MLNPRWTDRSAGSRRLLCSLRLYAAGGLAQRLSGELAVAEPDEGDRWLARGSASRSTLALPYDTQIEAELRGEGRRVCGPFVIPGGERVGSGLRVFVSDAEASEAVGELTLVGTGSGGYRAEPVYVDLPAGWTISAQGEQADCSQRHETSDGRSIWEVHSTALATSERGDKYLVRTGQKGDRRDTLALIGETARGCECADKGVPLLSGSPRLELCGATRPRAPEAGEGWWRPKNEGRWRPYAGTAAPGLVEFGWLDADTRHIRDRRDAAILPADFAIERQVTGSWLTLTISGWPGTVAIVGERPGRDGCSWRFPLVGSNASSCEIQLRQPDAAMLSLVVPLPHLAWIAHWTDGPVPRDGALSLSMIQQFVARTDGKCELMADLIDRDGRLVDQGQMNWWVDGELALSTIHDDVAALLPRRYFKSGGWSAA